MVWNVPSLIPSVVPWAACARRVMLSMRHLIVVSTRSWSFWFPGPLIISSRSLNITSTDYPRELSVREFRVILTIISLRRRSYSQCLIAHSKNVLIIYLGPRYLRNILQWYLTIGIPSTCQLMLVSIDHAISSHTLTGGEQHTLWHFSAICPSFYIIFPSVSEGLVIAFNYNWCLPSVHRDLRARPSWLFAPLSSVAFVQPGAHYTDLEPRSPRSRNGPRRVEYKGWGMFDCLTLPSVCVETSVRLVAVTRANRKDREERAIHRDVYIVQRDIFTQWTQW